MTRFRIICPECGAILIATSPLAPVFEACPKCRHHVWDVYDALLADLYSTETNEVVGPNMTT